MRNAPIVHELRVRFRVTHPFHPRSGQELELLGYRRNWGREVVDGQDEAGHVVSLPLPWTDAAAGEDPWLAIAGDRSYFRIEDLLLLIVLIERTEPAGGRSPEPASEVAPRCQQNLVTNVKTKVSRKRPRRPQPLSPNQ